MPLHKFGKAFVLKKMREDSLVCSFWNTPNCFLTYLFFAVYQSTVNSGDKQYGFTLIHCLTAVHNAVGRNGKILRLNKGVAGCLRIINSFIIITFFFYIYFYKLISIYVASFSPSLTVTEEAFIPHSALEGYTAFIFDSDLR